MKSQNKNHTRKRQTAIICIILFLVLIIGFSAGIVCSIVLSENYTIKITKPADEEPPIIEDYAEDRFELDSKELISDEIKPNKPTEKEIPQEKKEIPQAKKVVAIDAGHQLRGNSSQEPIGPGASQTKAKVTGGTQGVSTRIPEYQVNLDVALLLEKELQSRGYDVVMIRRTHEVDISNSQRAKMAEGADAFIRIHCNGSENSNTMGALTMCQTPNNPYCGKLYSESRSLSECVIDHLCRQTGAKNLGVSETDTMSGINWCTVPVTIVEMGFMSNPEEDKLLCDPSYQKKLVIGIADGIDNYFKI